MTSDRYFCKWLAIKYARRAVYAKDGEKRRELAAKARALVELAQALDNDAAAKLRTTGELP